MASNQIITEETKAEIRRRTSAADCNLSDIARDLGVNWHTVHKYSGKMDQPTFKPTMTEDFARVFYEFIEKHSALPPRVEKPAPEPPAHTFNPDARRLVLADKPYCRVAWVSDPHYPFQCDRSVDAAFQYLHGWKPDLLILGGDQLDCYSISDYGKDPRRIHTLQQEFNSAQSLWDAADSLGCDVIVMEGNHEQRLSRLIQANPALYGLDNLYFPVAAKIPPRFKWLPSQTHFKLGSLLFLHGDLTGNVRSCKYPAARLLEILGTSCVFGHFHRFAMQAASTYDGTVRGGFAMGHLSDVSQSADYLRVPQWQQGFGTIHFDHDAGIFHVEQHVMTKGKFVGLIQQRKT